VDHASVGHELACVVGGIKSTRARGSDGAEFAHDLAIWDASAQRDTNSS
jgi:hypothetical protein